jgi:hypothetical protein
MYTHCHYHADTVKTQRTKVVQKSTECSRYIIRTIKSSRKKQAGHVARTGEITNILGGKPNSKMPLGMERRGWENNIKNRKSLKEIA